MQICILHESYMKVNKINILDAHKRGADRDLIVLSVKLTCIAYIVFKF